MVGILLLNPLTKMNCGERYEVMIGHRNYKFHNCLSCFYNCDGQCYDSVRTMGDGIIFLSANGIKMLFREYLEN